VHLRSPSIAPGVTAFLWSLTFAVLVWAFLLGIGVSNAMAVLVGALVLGGSFVYIRKNGGLRRRRR
jgi:hypothetical protein